MPCSSWIAQCECGKEVDKEGYHLLTCKFGGGPVWEHNTIPSCWSDCLNELQICHHKEPRNEYADTEDRPDMYSVLARNFSQLVKLETYGPAHLS